MPCRLKFLFVSLALFFLVYLEERFLLFNFKQSSQHLHSDYLRKKNPETKLQMEPLFEKVSQPKVCQKSSHPDQFQKRYWQRFSRVKTVCERYHLGTEVKPTSVSNSEEEKYQKMERDASLAPEKTIMHLAKFSLLYCWVHKVEDKMKSRQNLCRNLLNQIISSKTGSIVILEQDLLPTGWEDQSEGAQSS